jgi:hypothetical protein
MNDECSTQTAAALDPTQAFLAKTEAMMTSPLGVALMAAFSDHDVDFYTAQALTLRSLDALQEQQA